MIILTLYYFENKQFNQRQQIYRTEISSKVQSIENNWTAGRSVDYILENGQVITLLSSEKLYIGDSIYKKSTDSTLVIYRKRKSSYIFLRTQKYN